MGLQSTPAAFNLLIAEITRGLDGTFAYLDDAATVSPSAEEHFKDIEMLFERLAQHKIKLNLAKCTFFQDFTLESLKQFSIKKCPYLSSFCGNICGHQ